MAEIISAATLLFLVMDPLGNIPIFLSVLEDVARLQAVTSVAVSPDGKYLAYTWPYDGGWELRLLAIAEPNTSVLLTRSRGLPLAPGIVDMRVFIGEPGAR